MGVLHGQFSILNLGSVSSCLYLPSTTDFSRLKIPSYEVYFHDLTIRLLASILPF